MLHCGLKTLDELDATENKEREERETRERAEREAQLLATAGPSSRAEELAALALGWNNWGAGEIPATSPDS